MKKLLLVCSSMALACALASAETYTGKLVDHVCAQRQQQQQEQPTENVASCSPTASTTMFALTDSAGKIYKLDADGNKKAAEEIGRAHV